MSDRIVIDGDVSLDIPVDGEAENIIGIKGDKGDPGEKGDKGDKGDSGDDYILTSADKADIANLVLGELDSEEWVFTLEDDSTVTKQVVIMP